MPKKDTILFSKDGTVGLAYKLREDKRIITSGAILHLNVLDTDEVLPDYLTLVLNSQIVQLQAERDTGGSIIEHWRVSEIENVVIPIIKITQQQRIADLVERSFTLKAQSEALLAIAKRGVELAIESDEASAQAWMLEQSGGLLASPSP
jgi:restriction endonuclease S subunit